MHRKVCDGGSKCILLLMLCYHIGLLFRFEKYPDSPLHALFVSSMQYFGQKSLVYGLQSQTKWVTNHAMFDTQLDHIFHDAYIFRPG